MSLVQDVSIRRLGTRFNAVETTKDSKHPQQDRDNSLNDGTAATERIRAANELAIAQAHVRFPAVLTFSDWLHGTALRLLNPTRSTRSDILSG